LIVGVIALQSKRDNGEPKLEPMTQQEKELKLVPVASSLEQRFDDYLQSRSMRNSEQRRILLKHVFAHHEHFDVDQLIERLPAKGEREYVSRPTVYRTLAEFVDAGLLKKFDLAGRTIYEHDYGYPQHDHMFCSECETLIEFQSDDLIHLRNQVAQAHGFRVSSHRFIVHGVCENCRSRRQRKRRPVDLV